MFADAWDNKHQADLKSTLFLHFPWVLSYQKVTMSSFKCQLDHHKSSFFFFFRIIEIVLLRVPLVLGSFGTSREVPPEMITAGVTHKLCHPGWLGFRHMDNGVNTCGIAVTRDKCLTYERRDIKKGDCGLTLSLCIFRTELVIQRSQYNAGCLSKEAVLIPSSCTPKCTFPEEILHFHIALEECRSPF